MNYFHPYPLHVDDNVTTAWKSQIAEAATTPGLERLLAQRGGELFPRFAAAYSELRALPRGARRALQRRLAHSRELSAVLQEWLQQQSGRALQQKLARTLAGAALLLVLGQGVAEAKDIIVTATVPGIVADGKCSLIEAILNANADTQVFPDCPAGDPDLVNEDHIILPAKKTISLTAPYNTYFGDPTGLPLITSKITIEGNGAKITRKKGSPSFRLMAVSLTGELELENVTLSGGAATYGGGGAVYNYGELTVTNSTITGNTAFYGGGIYNHGSLSVTNSTISKNTVKHFLYNGYYYGGFAGGIANHTTGTLTVTDSTITGNRADYSGGIGNVGNMEITGSTITKNSALFAGGIGNYDYGGAPTQTITNSTVTANKAGSTNLYYASGAGIFNSGNLTVTNSVISKNMGTAAGYFTGGGISNSSTLTIVNSTIAQNQATYGGGIDNRRTMTVENSTLAKNIAKKSKNAFGYGGAINNYSVNAAAILLNSTISGNKADGGGGVNNVYLSTMTIHNSTITGNSGKFYGGGVSNYNSSLVLKRSLISGNKLPSSGLGREIYNSALYSANNFNLFGFSGSAGFVGMVPGATDIVPGVASSAILSSTLASNGGPTQTHALVAGSPAIDAAPADADCPATDQRGTGRPVGGACDIGAFEGPP